MQSAKESAANAATSAKAGMEKTKATMQEKAERMTTRDPLQKEMATDKKDARIHEVKRQKQDNRAHNTATRQAAGVGGSGRALGYDYTAGGDYSTTTTGTGTGTAGAAGFHPSARNVTQEGILGHGHGQQEDPNNVTR